MLEILARNWWLLLLRGVIAVLFGILAFMWPGLTLATLVLFFGGYALVDGIFALVAAWNAPKGSSRLWALLLEGLVGIAIGVLTFFYPGITALSLLYFIAAWAIITGVLEILAAVSLRKEITGEWFYILSGALSIIFGVMLFANPGAGALAVAWLIGAYAVAFGVTLIILAFRVRGHGARLRERAV